MSQSINVIGGIWAYSGKFYRYLSLIIDKLRKHGG